MQYARRTNRNSSARQHNHNIAGRHSPVSYEVKAKDLADFLRNFDRTSTQCKDCPVDRRVEIRCSGDHLEFFAEGAGTENIDYRNLLALCNALDAESE